MKEIFLFAGMVALATVIIIIWVWTLLLASFGLAVRMDKKDFFIATDEMIKETQNAKRADKDQKTKKRSETKR